MNKRKNLPLSIFILVAVVSVFIFLTETQTAYHEIDSEAKEGQVAGAYSSLAQRRASLKIKDMETEETFTVAIQKGEKVLDVLKTAEKTGEISFEVKDYSFGVLLEELNGLKNGADGLYWQYFLNGEMPMVGIDALTVQAGDIIEFRFEKSSF